MYNELEERNGRTRLKLNRTYKWKHLLMLLFNQVCQFSEGGFFLMLFLIEAYLIYNIILTSSM